MRRAVGWFLMVGLLLWLSGAAFAAVGFDVSGGVSGHDVLSLSITNVTLTCGTNNALLVAGVSLSSAAETVSSATYDGVGLGLKTALNQGTAGRVEKWFLAGPTLGTPSTLTATFSTTTGFAVLGAASFCGVDQTTPLGTSVTQAGTAQSISDNVTIPTGGMGIEVFVSVGDLPAIFPVGGATERWNVDEAGGGQTRSTTGAMGWTWDNTFEFVAHIATPINPAAASVGPRGWSVMP